MVHATPAAEVDIDERLVRRLLTEQHRDLAALPLRSLASGWDNVVYRLGDELAVRLPRRATAARLVEHEAAWLPVLAPRLPVAVPAPVRVGEPGCGYPWSWTVVPWFPGEALNVAEFERQAAAETLGLFLRALHRPAPPDAPVNDVRGGPLAERDRLTLERLDLVCAAEPLDRHRVALAWADAVDAPVWGGPPMWLHGDLHPANIVASDRRVCAVIDFGDLTAGDPATDLMIGWALFDRAGRDALRTVAASKQRPIDDATWRRARGWAISHSLAVLAHSVDDPRLATMARTTLAAAVSPEG